MIEPLKLFMLRLQSVDIRLKLLLMAIHSTRLIVIACVCRDPQLTTASLLVDMVTCINKKILRNPIVLSNQGCHAYLLLLTILFCMIAHRHGNMVLSTVIWISIRCLIIGVHSRHMMVLHEFFLG